MTPYDDLAEDTLSRRRHGPSSVLGLRAIPFPARDRREGDTLVVQTTDFRGDLCLDSAGDPTTDATKTTERLHVTFGPLEAG